MKQTWERVRRWSIGVLAVAVTVVLVMLLWGYQVGHSSVADAIFNAGFAIVVLAALAIGITSYVPLVQRRVGSAGAITGPGQRAPGFVTVVIGVVALVANGLALWLSHGLGILNVLLIMTAVAALWLFQRWLRD